jgi:Peptidase family M28
MAKRKKNQAARLIGDESGYILSLIQRVVDACPERRPASEDEREAQRIFRAEFERLGLKTHEESFWFNQSLYANMALHFGLGSLGTLVSGVAPALGLALHATAGGSYLADSTRRGYFLRRLLPWKPSQNLMATLPAKGEPDLRIVLMGHADAAFTGLLFNPKLVKFAASGELPPKLKFLERSMEVATYSQFVLAGFDALRCALGPLTLPLRPLEALISLPGFLAFLLNMEIVLRDQIVPGANDNLTGCAVLPVLAQRLAASKPDNVELVFAVTGCEEASLGGADALAAAKEGQWAKEKTVIIGLDGLSGGQLRCFDVEGEVIAQPIPRWLRSSVAATTAAEPEFAGITGFQIPVGATDAYAFLVRGYDAVSFGCVDPQIGSPRNYHVMEDTPDKLDANQIMMAVDFTEALVNRIVEERI